MPKVRDVIRLVTRDGWRLSRRRGSHRQYRHPEKPGTVTIPGNPGDDVAPGTYLNILRQAGLREKKLKYAVIYERTPNNYSAYSPDLPGCISTGKTWEDIQENIREAITSHIESLMEYDDPVPRPQMSIEEAMTFHCEAVTECEDPLPQLETTAGIAEVEVKPPQAARA